MSGIYIHIPFCKQRCHYCDFYFVTNTNLESEFVAALKFEIASRNLEISTIDTIYFGGGTPSIIQPKYIKEILDEIYINYRVSKNAEITLEANPDDLDIATLQQFYDIGINRLSIGIQSFEDIYLKWMNRSHTASDALSVIDRAGKVGFNDFSIDLIYGIPGMDEITWLKQLEIAVSFPVNHLSCYCLTVEPKTPLSKYIQKKTYNAPDEEMQSVHFDLLMERAPKLGFEQYEISNFARDGHYSKHNSSYWNYEPYLGFGPSAHSFDGLIRKHHISSLSSYIKNPLAFIIETLSDVERYNEYVMIGLRTSKGINLNVLMDKFSEHIYNHFLSLLNEFHANDQIEMVEGNVRLTNKGKMFADQLAANFFM